jgi:hypothetical protein
VLSELRFFRARGTRSRDLWHVDPLSEPQLD